MKSSPQPKFDKERIRALIVNVVASIFFILVGILSILYFGFPRVQKPISIKVDVKDTVLVGRGDYLVNSVLACNHCHSPSQIDVFSMPPKTDSLGAGAESLGPADGVPGHLYAPNLTPWRLTEYSDGELFRLITTGIKKSEDPAFPVMPYENYSKMDSSDVAAAIAYLRTLKPIDHESPPSKINFPVNFIMRTYHRGYQPVKLSPTATPVEKGAYLTTIAGCKYCHSPVKNGKVDESRAFAGGRKFLVPSGGKNYSSNITPDKETGLGSWTSEKFVVRFKSYEPDKLPKVESGHFNSVMAWNVYAKMTKEDLDAIYQYLKTVKPVKNKVEQFVL